MASQAKARASGRKLFAQYCKNHALEPIERKQAYTVTDIITDLLHFARAKGWDASSIVRSAKEHFHAELVESCPKCGKHVTREDAIAREGSGDESGRTFYYCSEKCERAH